MKNKKEAYCEASEYLSGVVRELDFSISNYRIDIREINGSYWFVSIQENIGNYDHLCDLERKFYFLQKKCGNCSNMKSEVGILCSQNEILTNTVLYKCTVPLPKCIELTADTRITIPENIADNCECYKEKK